MQWRFRIGDMMGLILAIGILLGLLRIRWGLIFAVMAGGVVGCGLAPWYACRGMKKLTRELDLDPQIEPRTRATLVAQSYLLIWAAWYIAGLLIALAGTLVWWVLRHPPRG